jgi:hypothetical protein
VLKDVSNEVAGRSLKGKIPGQTGNYLFSAERHLTDSTPSAEK